MLPRRGLGHKPGHYDPRDQLLGQLLGKAGALAEPPARNDGLRAYRAPLLDQQDAEGCVGYSLVSAVTARWNLLSALVGRTVPLEPPSPLWAWWLARRSEGTEAWNVGCYIRDAKRMVAKMGLAPEYAFPSHYPGARFNVRPDQSAVTAAFDQRFPFAYYRIDTGGADKVRGFKQALSSGFPVVFGTVISPGFINDGRGMQQPPRGTDPIAGGHALTALWYDELGVYGPNSWGIEWGESGIFALSWDYIRASYTTDCWAVDCGLPSASWPVLP